MGKIPTEEEISEAYAATRRFVQPTPLLESATLARAVGAARFFVKAENLQHAGSFKIRGAVWRLLSLSSDERARGVVAYSSGNFAQGLAAAGQAQDVPVTIVMPKDAPALKRRATEALGACVVLSDHGARPREEVAAERARAIAAAEGLVLLHPFDDPVIVAGQAGAGRETLAQLAERGAQADDVFCPTGGGGLIGGVSLAFHHVGAAQVWACEPKGYDGMGQSLAAGELRRIAGGGATICDALQATAPGRAPFDAARAAGVRGLSVGDDAVRRAMRTAFERLKLVLEPSGAVALAAALIDRGDGAAESGPDLTGRTVVVFASGGNIAWDDFRAALEAAAATSR